MIWAVWIFVLLFISITEGHGLSNFPENFVLAGKDENRVLTCNTAANTSVTWKFNNDDLEVAMIENNQQDGQTLTVKVDEYHTGNYSCWSEEQMLSSVYLLLEAKTSDSPFYCWAKSYDCSFSCQWTKTVDAVVRVGLGPECTEGLKSCEWVTRSPGEGFVFNLSHSLSPYAEEKSMLEVTAEAMINHSIIRKTKKFFLREIIQPDSPQIVKYEEMDQQLKVTIEPPPTWSSPHSFFSLEHQIEYMLRDDSKCERTSSTLIPDSTKTSKLRVRCRDSLVLSNWSQWSNWKNVDDVL